MAYLVHAAGYDQNNPQDLCPMIFLTKQQASNDNPNVLGHRDAMSAPDVEQFLDFMKKEVDRLWDCDVYEICRRDSINGPINILNAVW